jgi:xanthine dehydrogenase molybdopterin-binding subunit B
LKATSELEKRRENIREWNAQNPHRKRGIGMTPVKFGISFTVTFLNQAGALVLIYQDGTVQVNHGGTEMGQGIHTNIRAIAARELGLRTDSVRVMHTSTDKVPNTSATAASASTDMNGAAVKNACDILRARLAPVAQKLFGEKTGATSHEKPKPSFSSLVPIGGGGRGGGARSRDSTGKPSSGNSIPAEAIQFRDGFAVCGDIKIPFAEIVQRAYFERISLSSTGYYRTPDIHWDRVAGRGKPFHYFAYGAAVAEVEVDGFTGMTQVLRADILQDVGDSINAGVNRGQVEGGFVQGMGWLTGEELKWNADGQLLTHSPDTYKIPSIGDAPKIFNVKFLQNATQGNVVHGSKAVGEPPLMLAISVREAIRDAVAAFGAPGGEVALASPATCEAIFGAVEKRLGVKVPCLEAKQTLA